MVIVGLGLGYLAEAWMRVRDADRLFVIEPDEGIAHLALNTRDLSELIQRATLYVGQDGVENLANDLKESGLANGSSPFIFEWPSIREYAPEISKQLQHKMAATLPGSDEQKLRILVAGPVYGGTLAMGQYVTSAFEELGHHVELLDYSAFDEGRKLLDTLSDVKDERNHLLSDLTRLLGRGIVAKAKSIQAQIVFFLAQAPGTKETLKALRDEGITTAMWFVEDAELANWWPQVAPDYDLFFHIQGEAFTKVLQENGVRCAHYLPVAADPNVHRPLDLTPDETARYGSELSHVGAGYFNRRRFFLNLLNYDLKLWGNDWEEATGLQTVLQDDGRRVSTEETVRIFNATRININLHSSTYAQGVNPHGDFVNPRTFELAACGAFQLVDKRSLLAEMFEPGKEIAVFSDLDECKSLIEHYLAHPEEANSIARAGRTRVLRDHTYTHRMAEAIRVLCENTSIQPVKSSGNTVAEMVAAAGDDAELAEFLKSIGNAEKTLTLEHIADIIRKGEGALSRPEALFLLMNEFQLKAEEKGLT
ncbi:hypothetical protein BMS3Bbin04_01971 [bacterium BMS3Bbin04]|nr:hypothetical protein BMS3Bbin04_01971 [bacterium BMS3Bbin04]